MNDASSSLLDQLKKASFGLLFMSESEAPLLPFVWEADGEETLTPSSLLQKTGHPSSAPVEVVELDDFFQVATQEEDWHSPEEKETLKRYQALVETLKSRLTGILIYRLGTVEIDVYIVGKTATGGWAGLSTKVVENLAVAIFPSQHRLCLHQTHVCGSGSRTLNLLY